MNIFLSFLSGILLILSFPKAALFPLAWVALVPLFYVLYKEQDLKSAFGCSYLTGLVFFGGIFYWVIYLCRWVGWPAILGWLSLALFQALFWGWFGLLYVKFTAGSEDFRKKGISLILVPAFWVFLEWLRALGPFGVTGGDLGYSQAAFLPILQIAEYGGVYAISFLIVLFNVALLELIMGVKKGIPSSWQKALFEGKVGFSRFILVLLFIASVVLWGWAQVYFLSYSKAAGSSIRAALVQGNVAQGDKLDYAQADRIIEKHKTLSREIPTDGVGMIFWPETAIPKYLMRHASLLKEMRQVALSHHAYFFAGASHLEYKFIEKQRSFSRSIYNSMFCFSPSGQVLGRYDKQHLVPFGEYLPLRAMLYPLFKNNALFGEDYNGNPKPVLLETHLGKVGVLICFESTFPALVRSRVKSGANFILIATNDAWFGRTAAAAQHIQCAALRAVENNRFVVQVANTGISGVFDDRGRLVSRTELEQDAVLIEEIKFKQKLTFYGRFGDGFIYAIIFGLVGWAGWRVYTKRNNLA